jgi:LPS sulfotransferase NodH
MTEIFEKKFVILTMQRSGSNALVNALSRHAAVHCDYQTYHARALYANGTHPGTLEERDADPVGHLGRLMGWAKDAHPGKPVYGFKLFLSHNETVLGHVLADRSWQKVILRRENTLDQFISEEIARQSGAWTSNQEQGKPERPKVRVDWKRFLAYHKRVQADFEMVETRLKETGQDFLSLDYSDIAEQRFEKVFNFLHIDADAAVAPHLRKQNPAHTRDKIANPIQVRWWLWRHGLSHMWVG